MGFNVKLLNLTTFEYSGNRPFWECWHFGATSNGSSQFQWKLTFVMVLGPSIESIYFSILLIFKFMQYKSNNMPNFLFYSKTLLVSFGESRTPHRGLILSEVFKHHKNEVMAKLQKWMITNYKIHWSKDKINLKIMSVAWVLLFFFWSPLSLTQDVAGLNTIFYKINFTELSVSR